jgi:hypothetical protein
MSIAFIVGFPLLVILALGVAALVKRHKGDDDDLPPTGAVTVDADGTEHSAAAAALDPSNAAQFAG